MIQSLLALFTLLLLHILSNSFSSGPYSYSLGSPTDAARLPHTRNQGNDRPYRDLTCTFLNLVLRDRARGPCPILVLARRTPSLCHSRSTTTAIPRPKFFADDNRYLWQLLQSLDVPLPRQCQHLSPSTNLSRLPGSAKSRFPQVFCHLPQNRGRES